MVLTKIERRLLNSIAVAQTADTELLDNYLYKLVLDQKIRSQLAEAVMALAACLASQGHVLKRSSGSLPIPAAALTVARRKGQGLSELDVAWPNSADEHTGLFDILD